MEETGVPGKNYRPVASHCQTLSHNVVKLLNGIRNKNKESVEKNEVREI